MRIQQLPIALANQIAAGEVIERPASVVKELLENALDAGADTITIDIGYGGLNQVKISDNGQGIIAEDLPLAVAAHATSKISQLADLYAIASMGFRGEALASIASISRLIISSKPANQAHAMKLTMDNEGLNLSPCARVQGTTIDVRDIFFNAPVRKKFLKSERSEFQAIEMVVRRFALSAPEINLQLNHNDKPQLSLAAAHCEKTRLVRIRKVLGKPFVDHASYLETECGGLALHGWVANQDYQRSQNDKQWVYVNGRMVKDKLLHHAIKQAYADLLYPGRHPACLLYLTLNPQEVDVNVHPTKHELRFQQPRLIHDFICSSLQQVLSPAKESLPYPIEPHSKPVVEAVYEPYSPPSLVTKSRSESSLLTKSDCIALNSCFALIFLQRQPYLADLAALHRLYLLKNLTAEALPLASRPLLVPVRYAIESSHLAEFSVYKKNLELVGITIDLAGEAIFFIRSIPLQAPHLDINAFLTAIFKKNALSADSLLALLSLHQSFDAQTLGLTEKEALLSYIEGLALDSVELRTCAKYLSPTACTELLNA